MQTTFTIGDLAEEFGVTLRTLRFYEDKGMLHPRREGLNRLYGKRDRARLKLILLGKRVGLSLNDIKEMLSLYELRDGNVFQLRHALKRFEEQVELLKRHRSDVDQAIDELSRTMSIVSGMLRAREVEEPHAVLEAAE
jgi:DNA-binding transcriptional MerR regulator